MVYQCFVYDKNIYFSEGIKKAISEAFRQENAVRCSLTDDYDALIAQLENPVECDARLLIFCDLDTLPQEKLRALNTIRNAYRDTNKKLVIVLSEHNLPLFLTLYMLLPQAHWLLKSEEVHHLAPFLRGLFENKSGKERFSHALINYTRNALIDGDIRHAVSEKEWWLMEEILQGKSLSLIASEVGIDIRRLSYAKRQLMKKMNIKNNIALFETFKGIVP